MSVTITTPMQIELGKFSELGIPMDFDYHIERLRHYPEGEWFQPNNKDDQDYDICDRRARLNLVETRTMPIWKDGRCRGVRHYFRYSLELTYGESEAA